MKDTLKFRLSMLITLTILLVGTLLAGYVLVDFWRNNRDEYKNHVLGMAAKVALSSSDDILRGDSYALYKVMDSTLRTENSSGFGPVQYIEVVDKDGASLAMAEDDYDKAEGGYIAAQRAAAAAAPAPAAWTVKVPGKHSLIDSAYPLLLDGVRIGTVRVGASDQRLTETVLKAVWKVVGLVAAACLLGFLLAGRVAGWALRPIDELIKGAEEFSSGNLDHRIQVRSPREMGVLAARFNQMAGRLKEKMEGLDRAKKEAEDLTVRLSETYNESNKAAEKLHEANEWVTDLAFKLEEANQMLKTEKVQTDTIVHSIRDGIVALDNNERVILVNPEAEDIFDAREDDVKGAPVQVLVERLANKVEDPEEFLKNFMAALSSPATESAFTVTLTKPYKRVLKRLSSAIRDERGNLTGRVVTFRDITREKEVDEMKTNFVSTVSHELRTPLTSIKGAINLLLDGQIEDPETSREFMRIADQNTDRLINLITSLLDLSRMEEGRGKMKFARMDLNGLVRSVVKSTSVMAKQGGVHVDASGLKRPLMVLGDRDNLEQVVTNLVGNAVKFSDSGGSVRVTTSLHEGEVRMVVEDGGAGIPRDKLEKIFDRFYQVDMSATRRKGGTGLGLAISRAIVKEHGGSVWAESPVTPDGKGARFVVCLPKPAVADIEPDDPTAHSSRHRRVKNDNLVLLVDTDPDMLKIQGNAFEREGFGVLTAATGGDALRVAREKAPGFILMDGTLPDLDGFDFAGILKNDHATSDVQIIFTNYLDEEGKRRCGDLGCGYVVKSLQESELIAAVRSYLKQGV